jgi:hypothetical protein
MSHPTGLRLYVSRALRHLRRGRGQGTVEYVGIVLAVAVLLLALTGPLGKQNDAIARKIGGAVAHAIDTTVAGDEAGKSR